jgi:dihydroorotate dehydrogenase
MIYRLFFRYVLRWLDAERAHGMAIATMRVYGWIPGAVSLTDRLLRPAETLRVRAFGREFRTPLGLAAGVDKNSVAFDALAALGFGAVEVGTVTNHRQDGNPRPRVWRLLGDRALQNAMGFPNDGAATQARRLAKRRTKQVLGVNVGKSKVADIDSEAVDDYRAAVRQLAAYADFLALNVSSPNTPGLRSMQSIQHLRMLVSGVRSELAELGHKVPLLIKLGPDLSDNEIADLADAAGDMEIDGIIAVNTTTAYPETTASLEAITANGGEGGISGQPLKPRALEVLELLSARVGGLPLISVGGIESAEDVWQRILSGATLVQVHTGFVYGGPLWPRRVNRDLARILEESPFATIEDAVGRGRLDATHDSSDSTQARFGSRTTTAA